MKILHLTIKKKWFNMIASGEKTEEYREIKPYWNNRLKPPFFEHTEVIFKNGYHSQARKLHFKIHSIEIGMGKCSWGAEWLKKYFVIKLGERIS